MTDQPVAYAPPDSYDPPALIDTGPSSENSTATPMPGGLALVVDSPTQKTSAVPQQGSTPPPPPPVPSVVGTETEAAPVRRAADDGRRRRLVLIAAAAVALLVAAVVLVIALVRDDAGSPDAGTSADDATGTPAEVVGDASVDAPSTAPDGIDADGATVSYAASNLTDGEPTTTWRTPGDATGEELSVDWQEPVTVSHVGMINGYAKVDPATGDERYGENRRVLTVTWTFDDGTEVQRSLEQTTSMQTFELDTAVETSGVTVHIDETSSPGGRDFTAISELSFLAR